MTAEQYYLEYIADNEPNGCYWCNSKLHRSSNCTAFVRKLQADNAELTAELAGYKAMLMDLNLLMWNE